jgi:diaminopimelate epimerase
MNELKFTKMHGAGNDFIMIDDMEGQFEDTRELISLLCEPHRGIGADGLILLRAVEGFDFEMKYFNRDGGAAGMCGNGARCAAKYAFERGIASATMTFATGAGPVTAEVAGNQVKIGLESVHGLQLDIALPGGFNAGFSVSGVPHAVILVEDASSWEKKRFVETARAIRYAPRFGEEGTNVNIVTVRSPSELIYRTYERGVEDETLACGTGALGVSVVLSHMGMVAPPVKCETSGGDLLETSFVLTAGGAEKCELTGPADVSFRGITDLSQYISS